MPLYFSHGSADDIVYGLLSRLFFKNLQPSSAAVEYHPVAGAGHGYSYWGSPLEAVFNFLASPDSLAVFEFLLNPCVLLPISTRT